MRKVLNIRGPAPKAGLTLWWKYYTPRRGEVTRTISPYRQDVITPLFKGMPKNAWRRIEENALPMGLPFLMVFSLIKWAQWENARWHKSHRY